MSSCVLDGSIHATPRPDGVTSIFSSTGAFCCFGLGHTDKRLGGVRFHHLRLGQLVLSVSFGRGHTGTRLGGVRFSSSSMTRASIRISVSNFFLPVGRFGISDIKAWMGFRRRDFRCHGLQVPGPRNIGERERPKQGQ